MTIFLYFKCQQSLLRGSLYIWLISKSETERLCSLGEPRFGQNSAVHAATLRLPLSCVVTLCPTERSSRATRNVEDKLCDISQVNPPSPPPSPPEWDKSIPRLLTNIPPCVFFGVFCPDFRKFKWKRQREKERQKEKWGNRGQLCLFFFQTKHKKKWAEEKPSDHYVAVCRCIQLVVVGKALAQNSAFNKTG